MTPSDASMTLHPEGPAAPGGAADAAAKLAAVSAPVSAPASGQETGPGTGWRAGSDGPDGPREVRALVIGAGQAGLSSAHFLRRAGLVPGVDFVVLDANPTPGGAWSHRWDALTFDDAHGIHDLPGLELGETDPREPAREVVKRYYGAFEEAEGLDVQRPWRVDRVERAAGGTDAAGGNGGDGGDGGDGPFLVHAVHPDGRERTYLADTVVSGTGTWDRPFIPATRGHFGGEQLTTRDFVSPEAFAHRRVLVVGGGTSAVQFLLLLEAHGVDTLWSTRSDPRWTQLDFDADWGRDVERRVSQRTRGGYPPLSVVAATGLPLIPRYVAGIERGLLVSRGPLERLTETGVVFADGSAEDVDVILWATGFRASLGHLAPLHVRAPGGGIVMASDDVSVPAAPGLFLVGYGPSASTIGATRAGRRAANAALRHLAKVRPALTVE